jgi:hypothetical protein
MVFPSSISELVGVRSFNAPGDVEVTWLTIGDDHDVSEKQPNDWGANYFLPINEEEMPYVVDEKSQTVEDRPERLGQRHFPIVATLVISELTPVYVTFRSMRESVCPRFRAALVIRTSKAEAERLREEWKNGMVGEKMGLDFASFTP